MQLLRQTAGSSLAAITLAGLPMLSCQQESKLTPPNIILILADDMGFGDVEVLNPESRIATPNLDRLATEGIIFTDAHTPSGVCTPTRYGLLTGRYCWRTGLTSGVLWDYAGCLVEPGRLTLAEMLQNKGYYTGMVGKWHLGIDWALKDDSEIEMMKTDFRYSNFENIDFHSPVSRGINDHGFHYSFAIAGSANMTPFTYIGNNRVTAVPVYSTAQIREKTGEWFGSEGHVAEGFTLEGNIPVFSAKACEFIETAVRENPGKPFFLYYPLVSPHTPVVPNKEFIGKSGAGAYGDFIMETDFHIGVLMEKLRELGVDRNTMIIFTSDNGPENDQVRIAKTKGDPEKYGHISQTPFRGWKRELPEGGHRVPFFIRWPEKIKAGEVCETTIGLTDIFPTLAELLNVELDMNTSEDGVSFLAAFTGKKRPGSFHKAIVHHHANGSFAIRKGNYKLILEGPVLPEQVPGESRPASFLLYDVVKDTTELLDIAESHPEKAEEMHKLLIEFIREGRSR